MQYVSESLNTYLQEAAAGKPAPGGWSVSALVGALAGAMSEMAANFTVGKKKFAAVEEEVREATGKLRDCRARLVALMQEDVTAYGAVGEAYGLPKDTEEQKAERTRAIQAALKSAMQAPLGVMRQCARVGRISERLAETANPNLLTDVAVGAILAEAACAAARFNVEINLKFITDEKLIQNTSPQLDEFSSATKDARRKVGKKVRESLL